MFCKPGNTVRQNIPIDVVSSMTHVSFVRRPAIKERKVSHHSLQMAAQECCSIMCLLLFAGVVIMYS
jgi:hypothetical protein